jgi:hypothetical protein
MHGYNKGVYFLSQFDLKYVILDEVACPRSTGVKSFLTTSATTLIGIIPKPLRIGSSYSVGYVKFTPKYIMVGC